MPNLPLPARVQRNLITCFSAKSLTPFRYSNAEFYKVTSCSMRQCDGIQLAKVMQGWPRWHCSKWRMTNYQLPSHTPQMSDRWGQGWNLTCTPTQCPFTPSSTFTRDRVDFQKGVKCKLCFSKKKKKQTVLSVRGWQVSGRGGKIKCIALFLFLQHYFLVLSISLNQSSHFCLELFQQLQSACPSIKAW